MTRKFKFRLATALPRMRRMWLRKKIGALAGHTECEYDYGDGCACIIGAGVPPLRRSKIPSGPVWNISTAAALGLDTLDSEERCQIEILQELHDGVCTGIRELDELRAEFNRLLKAHNLKPVP
jgi:hypothetical protein